MRYLSALAVLLAAVTAPAYGQTTNVRIVGRDSTGNDRPVLVTDDGKLQTTGSGGSTGGSSGGTGGAVTVANGADVAQGGTGDAAYSDPTGAATGTLLGINKGQYTLLSSMYARQGAAPMQQTGGSVSITGTPSVTVSGMPTVNNAQVNGTTIATGAGASNAGTQRVVVANDNGLALDASVAALFKAGQSVGNTGFASYGISGVAYTQGAGAVDAGTTRVTQGDGGVVAFTPGAAASAILFQQEVTGYAGIGFSLTGTWAGTVNAQVSDDNTNWTTVLVVYANGLSGTALTSNGSYFVAGGHRWVRLIVSIYTSGTVTGSAYLRSVVQATLIPQLVTGTNTIGGTYFVPSATATYGVQSVTVNGVTINSAKAAAGNLYGVSVINSSAAGYLIAYDAASLASGATLTAANIRWAALLGASTGVAMQFDVPYYFASGIQLIASTSTTTYTPLATAPLLMTAQAK